MPFVLGRRYSIWWGELDFENIAVDISPLFTEEDDAIVFSFNYTAHRELFEVYQLVNLQKYGNEINPQFNGTLDVAECELGDNILNIDNKVLSVCVSARGKNQTETYLQIDAIKCRYICEES